MLVEYIRKGGHKKYINKNGKKKKSDRHGGKRVGVLVSWRAHSGDVKLGWSLCHKVDDFNSAEGRIKAMRRAVVIDAREGHGDFSGVPRSIRKKVAKFMDRTCSHLEYE